jgi:hypothetical protein
MGPVKQNATARIQPRSLSGGQTAFRAEAPAAADKPVGNAAAGIGRVPRRTRPAARRRRGVVTLWLILALPVLLLLLIFLVEIGNIWRARVELENALEAAALAAVKEWGDSSGTANLAARNVGVTYAAANTVTGSPVIITTNHNPGNAPTLNDSPAGDLIFGAITTEAIPWVFCGNRQPSCGEGRVMIDASGSGGLQTANNNEWGIAFQETSPATNPLLRITRIEIDVGAGAQFTGTPTVSANLLPNLANNAVRDSGGSQADVFGFSDPAAQIAFTILGTPNVLRIDFTADPNAPFDDGFAVGDRFRFGANVSDGGNLDGDAIGSPNRTTTITVYYNLAPTATGTLVDTQDKKNDCYDPHLIDPITGTWVVSPSNVPDLPCPPTSAATSNAQSYEVLYASGAGAYGVRAQATAQVNSLACRLGGYTVPTFTVSACVTARYSCATRRPELVRVRSEDFFFTCP